MVVPPPMAAYEITCDSPINQVAFGPPGQANDFVVFTSKGQMECYSLNGEGGCHPGSPLCKPACVKRIPKENLKSKSPLVYYHVTWIHKDCFLAVTVDGTVSHSSIWQLSIIKTNIEAKILHKMEGHVKGICVGPTSGKIYIQTNDGSLSCILPSDLENILPHRGLKGQQVKFPQPCSQMDVCSFGQLEAVLGLTDKYRFYINDIEVANNCTSFCIHDDYLLLTTHSHTCRCVSRDILLEDITQLTESTTSSLDESVRRVERGSRIVTCVSNDNKLVLQMPRGNLETIHPRSLILSAVKRHLDKFEYKESFILMKKHRLNMNLLYDHNSEQFLSFVTQFVLEIDDINHLNLFMTNLREEDVTKTVYGFAYPERANNSKISIIPTIDKTMMKKVDLICNQLKDVFVTLDANKYLLPILTAYVRKTNPELDNALHLIKQLKTTDRSLSEEALKYLLFLVDVNELYDVALGTYDFELVILVAHKSQKDPKEYLPFLNQLKKLETDYQRFSIDKHLKRYSKALGHIKNCGAEHHVECLNFVKEHSLFSEALGTFSLSHALYKDLALAYGDYLSDKHHHEEAGMMYEKAESYSQALQCYKKSLNWKQAFTVSAKMDMMVKNVQDLASEMSAKLKDNRMHLEAATVLQEYADDKEEALVTLIEGHHWEESIRLMYKHNRTDFIESHLKSSLLEAHSEHLEFIETNRQTFDKYCNRLSVVREEKERKLQAELIASELGADRPDGDLFSDTSSATGETGSLYTTTSSASTSRSKTSGKSSKNRRKLEKKKWSLKEGSKHENLALIEALSKLITHIFSIQDEVGSLLKVLVMFDHLNEAVTLQTCYDDMLRHVNAAIPQIWNESMGRSMTQPKTLEFGPTTTANSLAQSMQNSRRSEDIALLEPYLCIPPVVGNKKWKLQILQQP